MGVALLTAYYVIPKDTPASGNCWHGTAALEGLRSHFKILRRHFFFFKAKHFWNLSITDRALFTIIIGILSLVIIIIGILFSRSL